MEHKTTDDLDELLRDMKPEQLEAYLKENRQYLAQGEKAFYYYMTDLLRDKKIRLKDLFLRANVSDGYGGKILRMEKHTAERDLIIRLCLAGHFNWDETNRALKLYGMSELYAKDPRDACLIVAINNRKFEIEDVDGMLRERGMEGIIKNHEESD